MHADPLLVERILRNLVANAIRYTEDGGVLVGCRRRGERLLLQVWDTGPGIREAEQQRVFEEFYQVPRNDAPPPGQTKGLGLGLAIVRRLAELMQRAAASCVPCPAAAVGVHARVAAGQGGADGRRERGGQGAAGR